MQMKPSRRSQAERHAATRAALITAARQAFADHGYAATGTEAVVRAAAVTRGALYHHFADKAALFAAVFEAVAAEVLAAIEAAATDAPTARDALVRGAEAFLAAVLGPAVRRIYLIDAPAVIGWAQWRAIDGRYAMGSLRRGVEAALAEHPRPGVDAEAATCLLSGALNEAALWLAEADTAEVHDRLAATFRLLVNGLFAAPQPSIRPPKLSAA